MQAPEKKRIPLLFWVPAAVGWCCHAKPAEAVILHLGTGQMLAHGWAARSRSDVTPGAAGLRHSRQVASRDVAEAEDTLRNTLKNNNLNDLMYFLNSSKTTACKKQGKGFHISLLSFILLALHQLNTGHCTRVRGVQVFLLLPPVPACRLWARAQPELLHLLKIL